MTVFRSGAVLRAPGVSAARRVARVAWASLAIAVPLAVAALPSAEARTASANDTARYLAGLPPAAGSPLAALAREPAWTRHAATLDQAWKRLDKAQLAPIRAWAGAHLRERRKLMLYMFSGPDFLYANAFFPEATTYVLSALEPVGPLPRVERLSPAQRAAELQNLRAAMQSVLSFSFFITAQMKADLSAGSLSGTLPLLYVFLARAGNVIDEVEPVELAADGTVGPRAGAARKGAAEGVRIAFRDASDVARALYYFRTDLSNGGLAASGLRQFCAGLGPADSLIKSASYLLHGGGFSLARDFLLENSAAIVQDDSGIPLRFFDRNAMDVRAFGRYLGPIDIFARHYQNDMKRLFERPESRTLPFGIGYRWRTEETNLLLAVRRPERSAKVD